MSTFATAPMSPVKVVQVSQAADSIAAHTNVPFGADVKGAPNGGIMLAAQGTPRPPWYTGDSGGIGGGGTVVVTAVWGQFRYDGTNAVTDSMLGVPTLNDDGTTFTVTPDYTYTAEPQLYGDWQPQQPATNGISIQSGAPAYGGTSTIDFSWKYVGQWDGSYITTADYSGSDFYPDSAGTGNPWGTFYDNGAAMYLAHFSIHSAALTFTVGQAPGGVSEVTLQDDWFQGASYPYYVDWGDNTEFDYNQIVNDQGHRVYRHTYQYTGDYTVTVVLVGRLPGLTTSTSAVYTVTQYYSTTGGPKPGIPLPPLPPTPEPGPDPLPDTTPPMVGTPHQGPIFFSRL